MFLLSCQETWPPQTPTITSIDPPEAEIGQEVTIQGQYFGTSQGTSTITFNGVDAGTASFWTAAVIKINVPVGGDTGPVVVTVSGQPSNAYNFLVKVTQTIGTEGGTIETATGNSIEIPTGAISEPMQVSVTPMTTESLPAGMPGEALPLGQMEILPHGITFNEPATIKIKLNDPSIPEGTVIPILYYDVNSQSYVFEGTNGVVDHEGFLVSDKIEHLSIFVAFGVWAQGLPDYKSQMIEALAQFFDTKNNLCGHSNWNAGFLSLGERERIEEFANNHALYVIVSPFLVGNSAAKYFPWFNTIALKVEPQAASETEIPNMYHEFVHHIFDVEENAFEQIGYEVSRSHEENVAYYFDTVASLWGFLGLIEGWLINQPCNYTKYSQYLNLFVTETTQHLDGALRTICSPDCNNDPIPNEVMAKFREFVGFDVDPVAIRNGYDSYPYPCGHCPAPECAVPADCLNDNACKDVDCVNGQCVYTDNTNPCDDGNFCTTNDTCSGGTCVGTPRDQDGDGHGSSLCGGDDCNDSDPMVYPGAPELCDGKDNNCNGTVDEGCGTLCPYGDGLYCGDPSKGQNSNYLYQCTNGSYSVYQECANGCQVNPPGTNDNCISECNCSIWQNASCGGGSCSPTQREQTRTCTPSGCLAETQCVSDPSCGPMTVRLYETKDL